VDDLIDMDKTSDEHIVPDDNSTANKNKLMLDMLEEKRASEQRFIEENYKILLIPVTRRVKSYTRFVGKYVTGRRKRFRPCCRHNLNLIFNFLRYV